MAQQGPTQSAGASTSMRGCGSAWSTCAQTASSHLPRVGAGGHCAVGQTASPSSHVGVPTPHT